MRDPMQKTLLFAEDEPELLEIYSRWFERLGHRVLCAKSGTEALAVCQDEHVDLVISDVRMAGGGGIELARQLQVTLASSPLLLFLTGFADVSEEEAYDLGACAILSKPIQREELTKAVERFLKPPRELWTTPLESQPNELVQKQYGSLESALRRGEINLGRGGMFVRDCECLPEEVAFGFRLQFAEGVTPGVDGCGIARWQRMIPTQSLPAGAGIEILQLDEQAMEPVVGWISRTNPRAFIPRA